MTRKISAQGDLDGACFLYSAANAIAALTKRRLSTQQWKRAIQSLPFKLDDYLTCLGTSSLDDKPEYYEEIIRKFCEQRNSSGFSIASNSAITSNVLRQAITESCVAIVAISKGEHWVCVVDADDSYFYISCSAEALRAGVKYGEYYSPILRRTFNRKMTFAKMQLWNRYALYVRRSDA